MPNCCITPLFCHSIRRAMCKLPAPGISWRVEFRLNMSVHPILTMGRSTHRHAVKDESIHQERAIPELLSGLRKSTARFVIPSFRTSSVPKHSKLLRYPGAIFHLFQSDRLFCVRLRRPHVNHYTFKLGEMFILMQGDVVGRTAAGGTVEGSRARRWRSLPNQISVYRSTELLSNHMFLNTNIF